MEEKWSPPGWDRDKGNDVSWILIAGRYVSRPVVPGDPSANSRRFAGKKDARNYEPPRYDNTPG